MSIYILPVLTYASETWALTKTMKKKLAEKRTKSCYMQVSHFRIINRTTGSDHKLVLLTYGLQLKFQTYMLNVDGQAMFLRMNDKRWTIRVTNGPLENGTENQDV